MPPKLTTYILLLYISWGSVAGVISGRVVDENNEPLPGATVQVLGTSFGSITGADGRFKIDNLTDGRYTLEISSLGFTKIQRSVSVGKKSPEIEITLKEDVEELEGVVIEGKSVGRELSEQPIQITSIELRQFQFESADVVDVLDRSAGVRVRQTGGLGSDANIQLNGFTGRAVRLYYDGIPIELLGGGIQINNLPVNNIDRVDVYKGVMPVDVGTDALAGGINVVPKLVTSDYLDVSYQYGSFNTHIGSLSATKVLQNNWFVNFSGFYNYSDNNYIINAQQETEIPTSTGTEVRKLPVRVRRFNDQHQSSMANVQVGTSGKSWADQLTYSISYNQRFDEIQHGVRLGRAVGEAELERSAFLQSLRYKKKFLQDRLKLDYFGNYAWLSSAVDDSVANFYTWYGTIDPTRQVGNVNYEIAGRATAREGNDRSSTQRLTFSYDLGNNQTLVLSNFYAWQKVIGEDPYGIRVSEDNVDPNTVPSFLNRFISGLSHRGKWINQKLESILFAKFYYYDNQAIQVTQAGNFDFDSRVAGDDYGYGLGFKYNLTDDFFLRASYERALRIPDASEVFGNFITIGANFNLRPEQSNNLNLGGYFKHRFDDFRYISLDASYFIRDQSDLIRLAPGRNENDLGENVNEAEVDGTGIEMTLSSEPIKGLQIDANFTSQEIITAGDVNTTNTNRVGIPIPNIPTLFYNISARYSRDSPWRADHKITLFGYYNFVDEFDVIEQGAQVNIDNIIPTQSSIDVGLTYATEKGYSVSAQVNNITNNEIFDNYRVPRPGINYSIKIRYLL